MIKVLKDEQVLNCGARLYQKYNRLYCELPTRQGGIHKPLFSIGVHGDITCHTSSKDVVPLYIIEKIKNMVKHATIEVHRQPTKCELSLGYGATHYKEMPVSLFLKGEYGFKKWTVCPDDGLRYYR